MKLKKKKKKRQTATPGNFFRKDGKTNLKGIKLADGVIHTTEHEKLGWFVGLWNNEKCHCRVANFRIIDGQSMHKIAWWKPYIGQVMQGIEIKYYENTFFISNEDGSGMRKVTVGKGLPSASHSQFEFVEMVGEPIQDKEVWNTEFDFDKSVAIAEAGESYWMKHNPEHWEHCKELIAGMKAVHAGLKSGNLKITKMN